MQIQIFVFGWNLKKNVLRCLKSLFLTSWFVLIFAFKRHHVFKTFLDHVHIHWVLKTSFQVVFLHKIIRFQGFKIFNCFDQSKISLDWSKMWAFVFKTLCLSRSILNSFWLIKFGKFSILNSWPICLFMHHFCLDSHTLHFILFYFIYLAFLQSYLK